MVTVIPGMRVGGAEVVAATLTLHAQRQGHQVTVASAGGFRADALAQDGVALLHLDLWSRRPVDLARSTYTLRRFVRRHQPELIHAHNVKAALIARAAAGHRTAIVTTLHGVPIAELKTAARILRWSSDRVVAVSPHVAEQLQDSGVPARLITVIENTITPLPPHPRLEARERLGLSDSTTPVVLCAARMVDQKRHDLLIDAWAGISDGILVLAGDGPNRPAIEESIARQGLTGRVRVLGERTDIDWLMAASDVVVLPTNWEGLPISLLEALSAGVPVVASRVGGVIETLGEVIQLVEPGSANALRNALRAIMINPHDRSELADRGRAFVEERYGADRMLAAYAEIYADLAR